MEGMRENVYSDSVTVLFFYCSLVQLFCSGPVIMWAWFASRTSNTSCRKRSDPKTRVQPQKLQPCRKERNRTRRATKEYATSSLPRPAISPTPVSTPKTVFTRRSMGQTRGQTVRYEMTGPARPGTASCARWRWWRLLAGDMLHLREENTYGVALQKALGRGPMQMQRVKHQF